MEATEQEGDGNARGANRKAAPTPVPKQDVPETLTNAGDPDRSDSDESDDSVWPMLATKEYFIYIILF